MMGAPAFRLQYFAKYIEDELGIVYQEGNFYQLEKRLEGICKNLGVENIDTLYSKAKEKGISGHFKQLLLDTATNNETLFFRDPTAFNAIRKELLPTIIDQNPKANLIRAWSAASSFGQEPYSLAMTIKELEKEKPTMPRFEIIATDISDIALKRAKNGLYSQLEAQRGLPMNLLVKYFSNAPENHFQVKSEIKNMVRFERVNLIEPLTLSGSFELILCRNVLIYQDQERKKKIIANLHRKLMPGGFLVMGAAESLLGLSKDFKQVSMSGAIFYQKAE